MQEQDPRLHLSQISTLWSVVRQAAQGAHSANDACTQIMKRYGGAVRRYLVAVVRDPHLADDLAQEFAVRFLRGDFQHIDPERGQFRNYLKRAVLNLITDHHRRQRSQPLPLNARDTDSIAAEESPEQSRPEFLDSWRHELLARAWEALKDKEERANQPFHTVLSFRAQHPDLDSAALATLLGQALGKEVTANWVRQVLYRARKLFTDTLLDDVRQSLDDPSPEQLQEELADLGLLEYCLPTSERHTPAKEM